MTNADVGGLEYANVSLCGELGGYDDAAKRWRSSGGKGKGWLNLSKVID